MKKTIRTEPDKIKEPKNEELRPQTFQEYIGQEPIKEHLQIRIQAAKRRGETLGHTLFYGPPGLGKTTLAGIIANEMGADLQVITAASIEKPGDIAAILSKMKENGILFIDEIHRLDSKVEETMYKAMEDGKLDITIGENVNLRTITLDLPKFTLIGATTLPGMLSQPFRDRFSIQERMEYYTEEELCRILERSAGIMQIGLDKEAGALLASGSRRTPRIANSIISLARDIAQNALDERIRIKHARRAMEILDIDGNGLNKSDRMYLHVLKANNAVGLSTLSSMLGDSEGTLLSMIEPYLLQMGYIMITSRGRQLTPAGEAIVK